jgi:hypothetical protein
MSNNEIDEIETNETNETETYGPSFPMETLPQFMADYIDSSSIQISCPPDFIVMPLLTIIGAAIGNNYRIEIKEGWQESSRLWTAVVAPPGTRKSDALKKASKWILRKQAEFYKIYLREKEEYDILLEEFSQKSNKKEKDNLGNTPNKPVTPFLKQAMIQDTTVEALCDVMKLNPKGIISINDELATFVYGMGRYSGSITGDRKTYLSMWSHMPVLINRVKKGADMFFDPFLSVTGFIQSSAIHDLSPEEGMKDGFIQRFLFFKPKTQTPKWNAYSFGRQYEGQIETMFDTLFNLSPSFDENGKVSPVTIYMTGEAQKLFSVWYDHHMSETQGMEEELTGAWAKLTGYCASFALILTIIDAVGLNLPFPIHTEAKHVSNAIKIIEEYVKPHANAVYPKLLEIKGTVDDECSRKIMKAIRKHGPKTKRELQSAHVRNYPVSTFNKSLTMLEFYGGLHKGNIDIGEKENTYYETKEVA